VTQCKGIILLNSVVVCRVSEFWWEHLCHDEDDYACRNASSMFCYSM